MNIQEKQIKGYAVECIKCNKILESQSILQLKSNYKMHLTHCKVIKEVKK